MKLEIDLTGDHHQQLVTAKALKLTATGLTSFPPNGANWEGHQSIDLVSRSDGGVTEDFWGALASGVICVTSFGLECR